MTEPRVEASTHLLALREVSKLRSEMGRMRESIGVVVERLDHVIEMSPRVNELEKRVVALETKHAVKDATGGVYRMLGNHISEVLLAIIATGFWWPAIKSLFH